MSELDDIKDVFIESIIKREINKDSTIKNIEETLEDLLEYLIRIEWKIKNKKWDENNQ